MFDNVALDVFIGLMFVFLLYSLLATISMEFIAHYMGLRPRMLLKALRRMLEDNPKEIFGIKKRWTGLDIISDFKESIKRFFYPFRNLPFLHNFYHHPTIKYLGESKSSSKPSYMQAQNFSETMIQILRGKNYQAPSDQITAIHKFLFVEAPAIVTEYNKHKHWILNLQLLNKSLPKATSIADLKTMVEKYAEHPVRYKMRRHLIKLLASDIAKIKSLEEVSDYIEMLQPIIKKLPEKISPDTLKHFQNLFNDAQYDFTAFKDKLENWFNGTMERATGWYKRQTQVILLTLGFILAIVANVDTISMYKILAKDKKVREQMVNMAVQSKEKYAAVVDTIRQRANRKDSTVINGRDTIVVQSKVLTTGDTLYDQTYKTLQKDIASAGNIMGLGWCINDSCKKYKHLLDSLKEAKKANPKNKAAIKKQMEIVGNGYDKFKEKWNGLSIIGWLITALAISLGAPFWFDMLNKVTRLRSAGIKETTETGKVSTTTTTSSSQPLIVNVNSKSGSGEEAVG